MARVYGNSGPGDRRVFETTNVEDMAAFDALPMPLRRELSAAPFNFAALPVLAAWSDPDRPYPDADCLTRMEWLLDGLRRSAGAAHG